MIVKKPNLLLLLLSIIPSGLAQGLTIIITPWYFTESLDASATFSFWYGIVTLIGLFWGLYAGVIIDQINRKKILLVINILSFIICCLVGLTDLLNVQNNHLIIFIPFTFACFYYMIFFPNLYALVQELSIQGKFGKINSIIEILSQTISILAALICGLLLSGSDIFFDFFKINITNVPTWELGELFLFNGFLYLLSYLILIPMRYKKITRKRIPGLKSVIKKITTSLIFFKDKKHIFIYGICSQIIFAFLIVELFTLLPIFVKNCLGEDLVIFSLADVSYCLGAIGAGLITIHLLKFIKKIDLTIILIILSAYAFLIMILFQNLTIFFIASLIIGLTNASVRITRMTYFFEQIPNHLIGRTNTVFNSINTIIRNILIFCFSYTWFTDDTNVVFGYLIGIYLLIIFSIPILIIQIKKLIK